MKHKMSTKTKQYDGKENFEATIVKE